MVVGVSEPHITPKVTVKFALYGGYQMPGVGKILRGRGPDNRDIGIRNHECGNV